MRRDRPRSRSDTASGDTLVIERHGEPIGFFVPVTAKDRKAGRKVLGRLGEAVESVLRTTDLTEDELVEEVTSRRRRR